MHTIQNLSGVKKPKQEQEHDTQEKQQLLAMMPDGFLCEYEGNEGRNISISFRPNPGFHPPTRETKVFHAMQGRMIVDDARKRPLDRSRPQPETATGQNQPRISAGLIQSRWILLFAGARQIRSLWAVKGVIRHLQRSRRSPHSGWSEHHVDSATGVGG